MVVFPAPLVPNKQNTLPLSTPKETFFTATLYEMFFLPFIDYVEIG